MSGANSALVAVAAACERLRRLPQQRWQQPPLPPLGARDPSRVAEQRGPVLEELVRAAIDALMDEDAREREVRAFVPDVPAFSLPDVLLVLARSRAHSNSAALTAVAEQARAW